MLTSIYTVCWYMLVLHLYIKSSHHMSEGQMFMTETLTVVNSLLEKSLYSLVEILCFFKAVSENIVLYTSCETQIFIVNI